jgi:amphi-Trp domain-containing protein
MANRDVEAIRSRAKFVATLRRVADALEQGEPVRIQVAAKRFVVPAGAKLSIEHEVEGRDEELELQLSWRNAPPPRAVAASKEPTRVARKKSAKRKN